MMAEETDTSTPPAPSASPTRTTSSSTSRATNGSGTVVALMGVTVLFALIGHELESGESTGSAPSAGTGVSAGGRIIVGGTAATAALVLLTHAGDAGRQFAVGLALVAMATTTLVYGGPVWDALGKLTGSSTPTTGTSSTTPTNPSTNTLDSTATIATAVG